MRMTKPLIGSRAVKHRPKDVPEICEECGKPTRDWRILLDSDGHKVAGAWSCGCSDELTRIVNKTMEEL